MACGCNLSFSVRKRSLVIGRGGNRSTSISEMHSRSGRRCWRLCLMTVFAGGRAETDRRRTFFHDAQFTSFFLQGAEGAPTDDVTSKQRSHCGVCLSLAAAKTVEAETCGNGTAADRGSWKRTTRSDDPSTLRPVARAHGPNEERGAGRRTAHERAIAYCACAQAYRHESGDKQQWRAMASRSNGRRVRRREADGSGPTWYLIDGEIDLGH